MIDLATMSEILLDKVESRELEALPVPVLEVYSTADGQTQRFEI
jgi:hypothetical protein